MFQAYGERQTLDQNRFRRRYEMANKYSKSSRENNSKRIANNIENKGFENEGPFGNKHRRGARIMAIVMIALMLVFTFLTAGLYLLN